MAISLNPSITRNNITFSAKKNKAEITANEAKKEELKRLLNEIEGEDDKKDGPIQKWKNFVRGWKGFWLNTKEYTKGFFQGLVKGGIAGGIVLGATKIMKVAKKVPEEITKQGAESIKKFQSLKTKHYILPAVVLASTIAVRLYKTSLKVSTEQNKLDEKYNTGHADGVVNEKD